MTTTRVHIDPGFGVGEVNRRIFGTFVEHMGRCVYTGIYEPGHPTADEHGFRTDVAALVRELGATAVRYPGGNFVSNYRWEDGVGPLEQRPRNLDFAWRSVETNEVGTNEFLSWCSNVGLEPVMAVNLGTRGLAEAMEQLLYVNGETGTRLPDMRASHGHPDPWKVGTWCLGNEMDGPWQMGHKTPAEYARLVAEVANAFHRFDENLSLVACGSSNRAMPTFGEWERVVLDAALENVDLISAHAYYEPVDGDVVSFAACAEDMDRYIDQVVATADHVAAHHHSEKKVKVSFDEWNVWAQHRFAGENAIEVEHAPRLIEDAYTVTDAVVVGGLLITLLRHTDRVGLACQAQLVNVIAPIRTEPGGPAWRQTIFHPFALTARHARGRVLDLRTEGALIDTPAYGPVSQVWPVATWDEESGDLAIFLINRSLRAATAVALDLSRFGDLALVEHLVITDSDPDAVNSMAEPDRVVPRPGASRLDSRELSIEAPALSWHCLRLHRS
jgi:alpha-N-arabinofuranosidase